MVPKDRSTAAASRVALNEHGLVIPDREELYAQIFQLIPGGILIVSEKGIIIRANQSARKLLNLTKPENNSQNPNHVRPVTLASVWDAIDMNGNRVEPADSPVMKAIRSNRSVKGVFLKWKPAANKQRVTIEVSCNPFRHTGMEGHPVFGIVTVTDAESQQKSNRRLRLALEQNKKITQFLIDLLKGTGSDSTLVSTMDGARRILDADASVLVRHEAAGTTIEYLSLSAGMEPAIRERGGLEIPYFIQPNSSKKRIIDVLSRGSGVLVRNFQDYLPKELYSFHDLAGSTLASAILTGEKTVSGVLFFKRTGHFRSEQRRILQMITPALSAAVFKYRYEMQLKELATTDYLTGLFNRRVFMEAMDDQITRGKPFALLQTDLDYFKKINDTYGHLAGDEVLRQFADILRKLPKEKGLSARTGGEEFMVMLYGSDRSAMTEYAADIRQIAGENPVRFRKRSISYTVSIGCTLYRLNETIDDIYARVDKLLYRAKENGRNRVETDSVIPES